MKKACLWAYYTAAAPDKMPSKLRDYKEVNRKSVTKEKLMSPPLSAGAIWSKVNSLGAKVSFRLAQIHLTKETTMRFKVQTTIVALVLVAGVVALALSLSRGASPVLASSARTGQLHVTKECSAYMGMPGQYCTITSSNLAEVKVGTKVFYDQGAGVPTGLLDSNVVLDAGTSDWAVGRCTLDLTTGLGLCTFSDGTGPFTGFHARVDVSYTGGYNYRWDGTYTFSPDPDR
jgi:hypothetical protein